MLIRATQVLIVNFKNGGRYDYYGVPEAAFEGMQAATSKGHFCRPPGGEDDSMIRR